MNARVLLFLCCAGMAAAQDVPLTLQDAIALAIENNLDVAIARLDVPIAATDVLRAKGGGITRGVRQSATDVPFGIGGIASPLINNTATGILASGSLPANLLETSALTIPQRNLALSTFPFSTGPAIPNFDPYLTSRLGWARNTTPQNSLTQSGVPALETRNIFGGAGFEKSFGIGTQLAANYDASSQNQNSLRNLYNPVSTSAFTFNLTQPLLRGFGRAVNERYIRVARNNQKVSEQVFRLQLMNTVYGVTRLYYDLVALKENVAVKQESVRTAGELLQLIDTQLKEGTVAPVELTRAQAQSAASRQDLINAEGILEEQEAILKSVLYRDTAGRKGRLAPLDPLRAPGAEVLPSEETLLETAFAARPDLNLTALQLQGIEFLLAGSRNALRPDLNLIAIAQNSGLAGGLNDLQGAATSPNRQFLGNYGDALSQIFRRNYPTYGVTLQLRLPLKNRVAQADLERDELELRQSQLRQQQLRNQVRLEVQDALIAVRRGRAAYEAAVETRQLQTQSLTVERAKYDAGASTSFFVIQLENLLSQARSTEVAARGTYLKSRAALDRAIGATLERNAVLIDQAIRAR